MGDVDNPLKLGEKEIRVESIEGHGLFRIKLSDGGRLPPEWEGSFTDVDIAKDKIVARFKGQEARRLAKRGVPNQKKIDKKAEMEARKERAARRAEEAQLKKEKVKEYRANLKTDDKNEPVETKDEVTTTED
jgi:hypothetical protein